MPAYKWDAGASGYRDLQTGDLVVTDPWGTPTFEDYFEDLSQWNVRNNFSTIDTARAMTGNAVAGPDGLHLLGTWLPDAPVSGGPQGFYTHNTGYIDQRALVDAANPDPVHYSQQYGRWEIKCKTPTGPNTRGALAAFWLRTDSGSDRLGEIDIMEAWGGGGTMASDWTNWVKDSAYTTFHSNTLSEATNGKPYKKVQWRHWQHGGPVPAWEDWVVYAFEYMPDYCATYANGVELMRVTPSSTDPTNGGTLAWLWDPDFFGNPFHMRINLHVGPSPSYWGLPDPENREWTVDPLDYHIEYVKAWRYEP